MLKFSDYILVTDLDDTLLTRDKRITEKDLNAVRYFVENGGSFTVATGRVYTSAKPYTTQLPINLPVVLYNGAVIYDEKTDKTLWKELICDEAVGYMNDILQRFPHLGCEIVCDNEIFIRKESKTLDEKIRLENIPFGYCDENSLPKEIIKILVVGKNDEISVALEEIKKLSYPKVDFLLSAPYYLEMLPTGASKWVGIKNMTKILGIENKKIVCAGDFDNDIDMIKNADIGATVPNAPQRVKDIADIVLSKTSNEGAISELIEYISKQEDKANGRNA
ncbi:MAG: Cof-type HAD-IIB family hydrolase [Oscillospiraceae bacterium]